MPRPPLRAIARLAPPPRLRASVAVLLALLAVAACGPLAADDGVRVDYRRGATYAVPAGGTLYLDGTWTLAELDLRPADVRAANLRWIPLGLRGESANAAPLVTITPPEAAEGWTVRLWQVRVVRERPLGEPDGALSYRIELELRVDVPEEAYELTRRVRTRLVARDGGDVQLDFLVRAE